MKDKTLENLTDKEIIEKFKKWLEIKKFGASIETEIKNRYESKKSLKGIKKIIYRKTKVWDKDNEKVLLKDNRFIKTELITPKQAIKKGLISTDSHYLKEKIAYSYIVEIKE